MESRCLLDAEVVWVEGESYASSTFNNHSWYREYNLDRTLLSPGRPGQSDVMGFANYPWGPTGVIPPDPNAPPPDPEDWSMFAPGIEDFSSESIIDMSGLLEATAGSGDAQAVHGPIGSARSAQPPWSGQGITRSLAGDEQTLAAIDGADGVVVKLARIGDVNGDDVIDGRDYHEADAAFLRGGSPSYGDGDVDYSGAIDGDDYFIIDGAFLSQETVQVELRVTSRSLSTISLAWTDNAKGHLGYHIERSSFGFASYVRIATVPAGTSAYTDRGLAEDAEYSYRVRAYWPGYESSAGSVDSVRTTSRNSIISWWSIGSQPDDDAPTRRILPEIVKNGWASFVDKRIKPEIAWGVRRILLWNPFGTLPGEWLQFDQYLHAQEAGLTNVVNGFVKAWKPITDMGIEVIAYIGSPREDKDADFTALWNVPGKEAAWQQRVEQSISPFIAAGMSIALDAAVSRWSGTGTHYAAQMLRQRGVKVYVEARPLKDRPEWWNFPWLIDYNHFDSNRSFAPLSVLSGEAIELIASPPSGSTWADKGWIAGVLTGVIREERTVLLQAWRVMNDGYSIEAALTL